MKCRSKKVWLAALPHTKGFSLPEVVVAVSILAFISASVLVVINRCIASATDSVLRMQAFEVARENMEKLLVSDSVTEMVEYGSSDKHPEIQWQTVVETFYEPLTERIWIRAVCSAEYTDAASEVQTVELTHWLTNLTKEQLLRIIKERGEALSAEQIIETEDEAADYAGVDVQTIQQWVENDMPRTEDGYYIKSELDLYKQTDGSPTTEDRSQQARADADLLAETKGKPKEPSEPKKPSKPKQPSKPDSRDKQPKNLGEQNSLGLPEGYENWSMDEIIKWLRDRGLL